MASTRFREAIRLGSVSPDYDSALHDMGKSDPPPPPDYAAAARAQGGANLQSTIASNILNRPTEVTPLGTRSWQQTGTYTIPGAEGNPAVDIPTFTSSINLTPEGQARYDQDQRISANLGNVAESGLSRVGQSMATPFSLSSADQIQNKAEEALLSRLEPKFARDEDALRTRLLNQGIRSGSEAFGTEMDRFNQAKNDARQQAVIGALQTRPQSIQEESFLRNIPLNELNALRTGSQVQMPQFQAFSTSNVQPAPIMQGAQAQGQADINAFNAQQAGSNATMGGLFSLGAAGLGAYGMMNAAPLVAASDRRLKSNIVRVGTHPLGIGIYEYNIFGRRERGVMADEVEKVMPSAVLIHPRGFKMVDYAALQ